MHHEGIIRIAMPDEIVTVILETEEKASREVTEASVQADKIRESANVSHDDTYDRMVASCKREAEASHELAKQTALERAKKIMDECQSEVARLKAIDEPRLTKAVELILNEILSGGSEP
jgi:vacuolar-type H+-ATPase subunit H